MNLNDDPRAQHLFEPQKEDFTSINPMAIWEAKKRLLHLAVIDTEMKVEGANYLVNNRLHYAQAFLYKACKEFIEKGMITEPLYNEKEISVSYVNPWFAPWVSMIKVFWDRIEYMIEDPCLEKHIAFRQSCTSSAPFSAKQRWENNPNEPFPVEKLEAVEDIAAEKHEFEAQSPAGVVWLHKEGSELQSLSIASAPYWIWEGEDLLITTPYKEDKAPVFLGIAPRDPSTKQRIDFLNGIPVSGEIIRFIRNYCLSEDSILFYLEEEECTLYTQQKKLSTLMKRSRKDILLKVCSIIDMFDQKNLMLLTRVLKQNSWLNRSLEMSEYEGN
jgi:hypothetical protein